MTRIVAAIILVAVLAVGGGIIATTAYQAGLSTAVTTTATGSGAVVAPVVVSPYAYGWHPFGFGFGIFGLLFTLFFLFIVFGLIRAIVWGGRHGHGYGWDRDARRARFADQFHGTFDDWHRQAHEGRAVPPVEPPAPPAGPPTTPAA